MSPRVAHIDNWQDTTLYGLFPEFRRFMRQEYIESAAAALRTVSRKQIEQAVESVPPEWQVGPPVREAVIAFLCSRQMFVADNIMEWIAAALTAAPPAGQ